MAFVLAPHKKLQALTHPLAGLAIEKIAGTHFDSWRQDGIAGDNPSDRALLPQHLAIGAERKSIVVVAGETPRPQG